MNRRSWFAAVCLLTPALVFAACSSDDSASSPTGDAGSANDSATGNGDGSTGGDGSPGSDGSTGGDGSTPPPPKKCGGAAPGTFSGEAAKGTSVYVSGYSVVYDGLLDAGVGGFSVACAFTDAGLVSHLPCPVGADTVQNFPNDRLSMTLHPNALDGSAATLTASVGDD